MTDSRYNLGWPRAAAVLLMISGPLNGQSTLAQFKLTESFGVNWPVQNIEMKYNGAPPPLATTAMIKNGTTQVPYQWIAPSAQGYYGYGCWDPTATEGCILIQDSLSGATLSQGVPTNTVTNTYTLESGVASTATVTNPVTVTKGTCQSGVAGWIVANGLTGFCVPQTQSAPYNEAPIQGIQLQSGVWTGAVSGTANLIYTPPGALYDDGYANPNGTGATAFQTEASIFTGETTTFIDAGPLKTSVQLSYTANRPGYYLTTVSTTAETTTSLSFTYYAELVDCNTMALYFASATKLPSELSTDTPYYNVGCTETGETPGETNYTTTTYQLSATPGGSPITFSGWTPSTISAVYPLANVPGPGHLTVTLTMYANRPSFVEDYDTDITGQWMAPMFTEVQPNLREYQGVGSTDATCGYETPLTITNISSAQPPVVSTSSRVNINSVSNQVILSGINTPAQATGTFYACNITTGPNGSFSLNTSSTCGSSTEVNGTGWSAYTSGGYANPQYTAWDTRGQRDGYYNIQYSANYIPWLSNGGCDSGSDKHIGGLGVNYAPNWYDSGWYDEVYNGSGTGGFPGNGNSSSPVVGIFRGRLSKQYNNGLLNENDIVGWFASNDHFVSAYNISASGTNCPNSGGTCAFGFEQIFAANNLATTHHGSFGFYVGTVGQLPGPNAPAPPIKVEQNAEGGPNLSSLYTYNLGYNNPSPTVTGASWSGGTETLALSTPTSITAGDSITVAGFTPSGYNCSSCTVTAVGPSSVSYALAADPGAYSAVGTVVDTSNPNYGFFYPYMPTADFQAWTALFNNSSSFCSSTGTCTGSSGYYNAMYPSAFPTSAIATMWHTPTSSSDLTTAYNGMWNTNSLGSVYPATGATWSSGTETLTIGPNSLSVGEEVNVNASPTTYDCTGCFVTGVTATTMSYAQSTEPPSTVIFSVREGGIPGVVNLLANGQNAAWSESIEYYLWYFNEFQPYFGQCGALFLNSYLTSGSLPLSATQTAGCKTILALGAAGMFDKDFWPYTYTNQLPGSTTTTGDSGGLGNQIANFATGQSNVGAQLSYNPYVSTQVSGIQATTIDSLNSGINQYGAGAGSLHYQGSYDQAYQPFQNMALSGYPQINFSNTNYPWAQHISFLLNALTPPDPRFGGVRKCIGNGDGQYENTCTQYAAYIAEGLRSVNSAASGNGMWGWFSATALTNYPLTTATIWTINPTVTSSAPTLSSLNFPGYWSVERYGFGTSHETSIHFINGDFYSLQGHRHWDDGQTTIFAHNMPLSLDWGALYDPDTSSPYCHNRIALDVDFGVGTGNLANWYGDSPNCALSTSSTTTAGLGGLLAANNTNFAAFTNSTQSVATFGYSDGSYWQRTVRLMAPDPVYPVIYVTDQFFNGTCSSDCMANPSSPDCTTTDPTTCKTLTWNLMANANDTVSTPAGDLTMVQRFSNGCSATATSFGSANDASGNAPYSLSNGLQAFGFTGYPWGTSSSQINWNLYERPTSGQAQFLIGNWGHGCNTSDGAQEFAAANASQSWYNIGGTPTNDCVTGNNSTASNWLGYGYCEQQDILRIHDTGPFETTMTPVTKGTTLPTISYSAGAYSFAVGSERWAWGDCDTTADSCYFTFTNGTEQVLTAYDANTYSAYGMTVTGGAQELVNNGGDTIAWTIEDVTTGTRCVALPPGTWYPSGPVQYGGGQYCYYHGGGAQPTPVTITFGQTPVTLQTVSLSYYAPPGATQVAVKFGSSVNYASLTSCSPICSVTLLVPEGNYTEQHSFLGPGGSVISTSQPVSFTY